MAPRRAKREIEEERKLRGEAESLLRFAEKGSEATLASTLEILNSQPPAAYRVGLDYHDDVAFGKAKRKPTAGVSKQNILEPRAKRAAKASQKVIENTITEDKGATMAGKRRAAVAATKKVDGVETSAEGAPIAKSGAEKASEVETSAEGASVASKSVIVRASEVETSAEGASVATKSGLGIASGVETSAEGAPVATNAGLEMASEVETSAEGASVAYSGMMEASGVETSAEGAPVAANPGMKKTSEVETSAEEASVVKTSGGKSSRASHAESSTATTVTGRQASKAPSTRSAPKRKALEAPSTAPAPKRKASKAPSSTSVTRRLASEAPSTKSAPKRKASEAPATAPAPKRKALDAPSSISASASASASAPKRKASEAPSAKPAPKRKAPAKAPATKTAAKGKAPAKASTTKKSAKGKAAVKNEEDADEPTVTKKSTRGRKRKGEDDDDDDNEDHPPPPVKKAKVTKTKAKPVINAAPTEKLDVYVFGEGSSGELGLGKKKNAINVKRPRLNPFLLREEVGVVHVACGGMHVGAITHDNQILTWGVNDQGALGRDTAWNGNDNEEEDVSDDEDELAFNPHECVPKAVDSKNFPEGTVFVMMACGDSFSMVLTATGDVYGWGTFRSNEGVFGFSTTVLVQHEPTLLPTLKNITRIACGANHAMALNKKGEVFIWGCGQQNQLGHRLVERRAKESLQPRSLSLTAKNIRFIGCGQDHSFAIGRDNRLWVWGVNSFGETSIPAGAGGDRAMIFSPQQVQTLTPDNDETVLGDGETITSITGGIHHSIAVTSTGRCLIWGRMDGDQVGIPENQIPKNSIMRDEKDQARILIRPTEIPGLQNIVQAAIGSDHTIVINEAGEAYSWGFNVNYQCGLGIDDDIKIPTRIENTAVRGKKLLEAGGGGQYSILTGLPPTETGDEE